MSKKIRNYPTGVAPYMTGINSTHSPPYVNDAKTGNRLDPNNLDDKILIYERQVKGWFLDRAARRMNTDSNIFLVLMVCLSYIEGIEQFKQGRHTPRGMSRAYFVSSMKDIFNIPENKTIDLEEFYSEARCGLFHSGMTDGKIILSYEYPFVIDFSEPNSIRVNPREFYFGIRNHFERYIRDLKNNKNSILRNNFNSMFRIL